MFFIKKSFKNKLKQDFSDLFNFLDSNAVYGDPNKQANKFLVFGDNLKFSPSSQNKKKTFNVPYFDNYRDVNPELLLEYYFDLFVYYRNLFSLSKIFILFLILLIYFLFLFKKYKFIFCTYTFYFIDYIYDLEDLFSFLSNIFK